MYICLYTAREIFKKDENMKPSCQKYKSYVGDFSESKRSPYLGSRELTGDMRLTLPRRTYNRTAPYLTTYKQTNQQLSI